MAPLGRKTAKQSPAVMAVDRLKPTDRWTAGDIAALIEPSPTRLAGAQRRATPGLRKLLQAPRYDPQDDVKP